MTDRYRNKNDRDAGNITCIYLLIVELYLKLYLKIVISYINICIYVYEWQTEIIRNHGKKYIQICFSSRGKSAAISTVPYQLARNILQDVKQKN